MRSGRLIERLFRYPGTTPTTPTTTPTVALWPAGPTLAPFSTDSLPFDFALAVPRELFINFLEDSLFVALYLEGATPTAVNLPESQQLRKRSIPSAEKKY